MEQELLKMLHHLDAAQCLLFPNVNLLVCCFFCVIVSNLNNILNM